METRILAGTVIFLASYVVFALGKFPGLKIDRTGAAIIGAIAMVVFRVLQPEQAIRSVDFATIVLLFAMILVQLLLLIEARRYRFFDVYRGRVRRIEKHYFAQIFAPVPGDDTGWSSVLGQDLRRPQFLISIRAAMSRRLRRNYLWMFLVLLLAWVLKISTPKLQVEGMPLNAAHSWHEIIANAV